MIPDSEDFGSSIRLDRRGKEVRLTFVAETVELARDLYDRLQEQLRMGVLFLSLTGEAKGGHGDEG